MSLDVYLMIPECAHCGREQSDAFSANITHNLNQMAEAAGIYKHLWRPEEIGIVIAKDLVAPLEEGIRWLKEHEAEARKFDSPNGWGVYEHFVPWIERYLDACKRFPRAVVGVSR